MNMRSRKQRETHRHEYVATGKANVLRTEYCHVEVVRSLFSVPMMRRAGAGGRAAIGERRLHELKIEEVVVG